MVSRFTKIFALAVVTLFAATSLQAGKVSAYLDAGYVDAKTAASKLKKAGFEVLTTYSPAGLDNISVIIYTSKSLKSMANKKMRGFAAIQRVMVDSKAKTLRVTNPVYWSKAFMQGDYKAGTDKTVTASLEKAFGNLTGTKDVLDEGDLKKYHFMMGMPYYDDMLELASGKNVRDKKKLFEVKLGNGSTLVGVKMSKAAEGFVNKIGTENAILLPYTILIEDGNAYGLHAKYYLAISYPLLSMGQFMKISSAPDTIKRALKKSLK